MLHINGSQSGGKLQKQGGPVTGEGATVVIFNEFGRQEEVVRIVEFGGLCRVLVARAARGESDKRGR